MSDLKMDPVGTAHPIARCAWCRGPLVIGEVAGLRCWLCPMDYRRQVAQAFFVTIGAKSAKQLGVPAGRQCRNVPLPSQVIFEECSARNILWGGEAGPGKSHGAREWLYKRSLIPKHQSLLLRETHHELETTHLRYMERDAPLLGAIFRKGPPASLYFPATGAYIDCGHMSDPEAVRRYLSTEYGAIVAEEGATYPLTPEGVSPLGELATRARQVCTDSKGKPVQPVFLVPTNPGGPSTPFLLDFFIDHAPDFDVYPQLKQTYDPSEFAYLPAKLDDNPYMDPGYEQRLRMLPKWRYEQLRHGDFRVFAGQFFSGFRESHHVKDWGTPSGAQWFRSMDWGYHAPGAMGWWAILPDHRLYIRTDWKFQGLDEPDVATRVKTIDRSLGIRDLRYTAADPAMWGKTGATHKDRGFVGQSIAQTLMHYGMRLVKADHDRYNGWKRCVALLRDAPDGDPWLVFHPDAAYLRRTIPAARSDRANPEDVDTSGDDHALDMWRYGAMSPAVRRPETEKPRLIKGSMGELRDRALKKPSRRWGQVA